MSAYGSWILWAVLSAVFAAATAVLAKIGVSGVSADFATLVRATFIVVLLGAFVFVSGQWISPRSLSSRNWIFLALSALATGASWVCYFRALQIGDASQVAPVDKLSVALVAVFAVIFLGERPAPKDWTGIGLIVAGAVLLSLRR